MQLQDALNLIEANFYTSFLMIAGLWAIHFVNLATGMRLSYLGIYPRHLIGLIGIIFSPFLHGSITHLFFNSIPLFVLICFVLVGGIHKFIYITAMITLISGFGVWLMGRRAIHIGASSLVMGYWGYLLVDAIRNPNTMSVMLGVVCVYYFGGLFFSLFPEEESVSFEGHIFGFLAGIATSYIIPILTAKGYFG
jgi:membrane associated rhomboid family serine protease